MNKLKTIKITLNMAWNEPTRTGGERIEGFKIVRLVNAVSVQVGDQKLGLGYFITKDQAEELNARPEVEITVAPIKG